MSIPPSAREAAKETTEEVMKALDSKMRAIQSLYSQVSCSEMSAMNRTLSDVCAPLGSGNGEDDGRLDWRADPFRSGSDLTLNVYTTTTTTSGGGAAGAAGAAAAAGAGTTTIATGGQQPQPTTYYAHALLLAHGGRKSGFVAEHVRSQRRRARGGNGGGGEGGGFGRRAHDYMTLRRQNSNVSSDSSSKLCSSGVEYRVDVHVPSLAAKYVPQLLDYVYGSSLKLTTHNAPPLRYLSNRFDCRDLHREITSVFVPRDLDLATAPRYAAAADELGDVELRDRSLRYMAERFDRIIDDHLADDATATAATTTTNTAATTFGCMDPKLMRRLLQSERLVCASSERLSEGVARYLRLVDRGATAPTPAHPRDDDDAATPSASASAPTLLSDEDFYWLTHCQIMPRISPSEALFYYALGARRYPRVMAEVGSGSLRSRCLSAAVADASVMGRLSSRLEERIGGCSGDPPPQPPDDSAADSAICHYETLDPGMKVEILESMMVGSRRVMAEGERRHARREGMDLEMRMSDEMMYKKISNNHGGGKTVYTTSVSNEEDGDGNGGGGGGGGYGDDDDGDVSKAVVLGCGAGPANGIYISVVRRRSARDEDYDDDATSAGRRRRSRSRRSRRRGCGVANDDAAVYYEREAVWNGKRVAFVLYPVTSGQFYVQYKLGVRHRDDDYDGDECDGDRRRNAATAATRVLYNSPKIVVGDAAVGLDAVIIPDRAWEMEDDDAHEGLRPPPQFVGRVERPVMISSRLNNSLMDSPPERGGWVT